MIQNRLLCKLSTWQPCLGSLVLILFPPPLSLLWGPDATKGKYKNIAGHFAAFQRGGRETFLPDFVSESQLSFLYFKKEWRWWWWKWLDPLPILKCPPPSAQCESSRDSHSARPAGGRWPDTSALVAPKGITKIVQKVNDDCRPVCCKK